MTARRKSSAGDIDVDRLKQFHGHSFVRHLLRLADWSIQSLYERVEARGHRGLRRVHESVFVPLDLAGSRLVDIARASHVSKNAIGQLANELEVLGYVERVPDADDGRAKNLRYTRRGLHMLSDSMASNDEVELQLARLMGERKMAQLKKLVAELAMKLHQVGPEANVGRAPADTRPR